MLPERVEHVDGARIRSSRGRAGKIVVSRILPGSDLVTGLIGICRAANINTGVISTCVGSLRRAEFRVSIPSTRTKRGSERSSPIVLDGPIEFLSGQGFIGITIGGETVSHVHGILCDREGHVVGGHIFPGGNIVHSTMDVVVIEVEGVRLANEHDAEIDLVIPMVEPTRSGDGVCLETAATGEEI